MDMFRICAVGQQADSMSLKCHFATAMATIHVKVARFFGKDTTLRRTLACAVSYTSLLHISVIRKCLFTLFIFDFFLHL